MSDNDLPSAEEVRGILKPDVPAPIAAITPMEMLNAAVARGADMELLTKLMDLQDRWERGQARKAYEDAIARAKAEIPPIPKNRRGHGDRKYADLAGIAEVIDPVITKHGLSYRWRTTQTDRWITVTCVITHRAGHYEENTLGGPTDVSGSKNPIQAIGSSLTYLQRYTLKQALGLSETDDEADDNGVASGGERKPPAPARNVMVPVTEYSFAKPKRTSEPLPQGAPREAFPQEPPPHDADGVLLDEPTKVTSEPIPPPLVASSAAGAGPSQAVSPERAESGPASNIPTAAVYIERWEAIIEKALEERRDPQELGGSWNLDKKTRNKIKWDNDEQFLALKDKIIDAVEKLK